MSASNVTPETEPVYGWLPETLPDDPNRALASNTELDKEKEVATRYHRIYEAVSKNIERENALINFRITWAIVLSGGLLAAEGVIINYISSNYDEKYWVHVIGQLSVVTLSSLALFFCFRSWRGVIAAQDQMEHVKACFWAYRSQFAALKFPRPFGTVISHAWGNGNAIAFPIALLVIWSMFWIAQSGWLVYILTHKAEITAVYKQSPSDAGHDAILKQLKELSGKVDTLLPVTSPPVLPAPPPAR